VASAPSLSRADMERIIQEGGSVLLPAQPGQIGRVITRLEDLPPEDRLAQQGLADPRAALADLERQAADLARRKADLLRSLPPVESVTTPEEPPVESVTTSESAPPEEVPPEEADVESVTTSEAADLPEEAPQEETGDRPAGRRRKGW
jgi:hypothetical protein